MTYTATSSDGLAPFIFSARRENRLGVDSLREGRVVSKSDEYMFFNPFFSNAKLTLLRNRTSSNVLVYYVVFKYFS